MVLVEMPNSWAASFGCNKRLFFIHQVYQLCPTLSNFLESRHRSRLQQVHIAIFNAPLDILGLTEALLQLTAKLHKLADLFGFEHALIHNMFTLDIPCAVDNIVVRSHCS